MSSSATLASDDSSTAEATPAGPLALRLVGLARQILEKSGMAGPIPVGEQLSALGLSSLDMVNLMIAVEAEFDVAFPANEITPANFRSIASIEALLLKIGARPSAG
jgi:acyl carrier protein